MNWKELVPKKNNEQTFVELEEDSPELNKMIGYNLACDDHQLLYDYVEKLERALDGNKGMF